MIKNFPQLTTQLGVTLIETLVGLVAGLILMATLISVSALAINYSSDILKRDRLNNELRRALILISDDITRAGYWGQAYSSIGSGSNANPFMSGGNDISINANGSCILFSYDRDQNGAANSSGNASSNEHFGFRLSGGALQALTDDTDFNCSSTSSSWVNLTDPNTVNISTLNFNLSSSSSQAIDIDGAGPGTATTAIRYITISITGQLVTDTSVTQSLTTNIRVRNDRYSP